MFKLNNKGMSIVEIVVTFSIIMIISVGLLSIVVNYRNKISVSLERLKLDTFKNNVTQDIYNDILNLGVTEINTAGECSTLTDLNRCVNIVFQDGSERVFGTSKVEANNKNSIEEKFVYYDGIKYKLKDYLPDNKPSGRVWKDLEAISINDDAILSSSSTVLEDGTKINIYRIDTGIEHIDFTDDFGIHIVATTDDITL